MEKFTMFMDCIESIDCFGYYTHFTILILLMQEHSIFLHLLVSSLISFISVLQFSIYRSFVSLSRFIPMCFILFIAMVNGIVSLIFLSVFSLLVYRNPLHSYTLTMRKQKQKLRKQFHSPLQQKELNTQEYIHLKKQKTYIQKTIKH